MRADRAEIEGEERERVGMGDVAILFPIASSSSFPAAARRDYLTIYWLAGGRPLWLHLNNAFRLLLWRERERERDCGS